MSACVWLVPVSGTSSETSSETSGHKATIKHGHQGTQVACGSVGLKIVGRPATARPCAGACGVVKHCECVAGTLHSKQTTATQTFSPFPPKPFVSSGQVSRTNTHTHTQLKDLRLKLKAATSAAPSAVASMSSSSALASPGGPGVKGGGEVHTRSTMCWRQQGDRSARSVQACVAKWKILNIAALSRSLSIQ